MHKAGQVTISEEEWRQWLLSPVTQRYRAFLQELVVESKEAWANGVFTEAGAEATAMLNANALGRVGAILDLLDLQYGDVCEVQV